MIKVLFVCLGNICRSPTAEAVFRDLVKSENLAGKITTDSAGIGAWHVGDKADGRARKVAASKNIDMEDLRARQFNADDYHEFDYVLAMDHSNYRNMDRLDPGNGKAKLSMMLDFSSSSDVQEVPDPYYGGMEDYELVFELLIPAAKGLLDHIRQFDLNQKDAIL